MTGAIKSGACLRVPGKVMLAGEYAVLAGKPAMVAAVRKYLQCTVTVADRFAIEGNNARWEEGQEEAALSFACQALQVTRAYLAGRNETCPPIKLNLVDDLRAPTGKTGPGPKLGLGGSACSSVAVVAATLWAARGTIERGLVFYLAATAHGIAQKRAGSAVDVAASTFGGTLYTERFVLEPAQLALQIGPKAFAEQVDGARLPAREPVNNPFGLLLAFSGNSASTSSLVEIIDNFARNNERAYADFLEGQSEATNLLKIGLQKADEKMVAKGISLAERQLESLGEQSGAPLVTAAHREIIASALQHNLAGKISGAGGGDCCVALGSHEALVKLQATLEKQGIFAWIPELDTEGVRIS